MIFIPKPGKDTYSKAKSFRPISLSNYILKGMERLYGWHMKDNLETFPIHDSQHGFCSDKSTESALSSAVTTLEQNKTNNKHTIVSSLDIQAAFDSITPSCIKTALLRHGSRKEYAEWYHSYITHRNLETDLKGETYKATTSVGFPQGGVVSADFWKIAFNPAMEIVNSNPNIKGIGYADDLLLLKSGYKTSKTVQDIQNTLNKLITWGKTCGLYFNPDKTIVVYFGKNKTDPEEKLMMNNKAIPYSKTFRYLGVTIDNKLSWEPHRTNIIQQAKGNLMKLSSKIATLYGPNPQISKWIYTGIIREKIAYASLVWAHTLNTQKIKQQFDKLNKLACAMITPSRKSISPNSLEIIYDVLPLPLYLQQKAIATHNRILPVITRPNKPHPKSHLLHWESLIQDLGIIYPDIDRTNALNLNNKFMINTDSFDNYTKHLMHSQLNVYTDGSKTHTGTGAGFVIYDKQKLVHKDYFPLSPTATVYQAEVIAIGKAAKFIVKFKKSLEPKYVKIFTDSRSTLQALDHHKIKAQTVLDTVNALNTLGSITKRTTLNWIKAHNQHAGNDYADKMANIAAKCTEELEPVPIANKLFKNHVKTAIYAEWIHQWTTQAPMKFKHTREFFPIMDPKYSKRLLKLNRYDLKLIVELITGHNNLRTFSTKIKTLPSIRCRFCNTSDETVLHLLLDCKHFSTHRYQLKIPTHTPLTSRNILNWSPALLLAFFKEPQLDHILTTNLKQTNSNTGT